MARKPEKFIQGAIKRPGALTKLVGGPPGENVAKVQKIARTGTPLEKQQANFFLRVLLPLSRKRGKKKKSLL
jgi:hypothetical protein